MAQIFDAFGKRLAGFALVCSVVAAAVIHGLFSSDDQLDASAGATAAQTATTVSDGAEDQPIVVAADHIKSVGPTGSTSTSPVDPNRSESGQSTPCRPADSVPTNVGIAQLVLIDDRTGLTLMPLSKVSVIRRDEHANTLLSVEAFTTPPKRALCSRSTAFQTG